MEVSDAKQFIELEEETRKLKMLAVDLTLDKRVSKDNV
jgi:hypothetical protein